MNLLKNQNQSKTVGNRKIFLIYFYFLQLQYHYHSESPVVTTVVQNHPPEIVEVRPRRTSRKSNNILVSQNAASSFKRANTVSFGQYNYLIL